MPGTIQVSVLGLNDVQTSSGSSHSSIKVSMGKREYQTSDTGDYSFPVMTLREKLIVTLVDANGNDKSRREIETRLIIERGFLEEKLSLGGGGKVHLKLQFVLSEEDRDRIRFLRQSALRKKHEELVYGNTSKPKFITSGLTSQDIRDLKNRDDKICVSKWSSVFLVLDVMRGLSSLYSRKMAADEQVNIERNMGLSQETECKTIADGEPVASNPVALRRSSSEVFACKESSEVIKSDTVSNVKENMILNKLETTEKPKSMRRSMSERNLSNVKEMISAFEIGLTQDKKIRAAKTRTCSSTDEVNKNKTQDKKIWVTKIQTGPRTDEVNENKVQSRQENSVNLKKSENTEKSMCTENTHECNNLSRHPRDEKTMVSVVKNLEEQPRSNLLSKQSRKRSSVAEGGGERENKFIYTEDSQHCNVRGSRLWIFPEGAKDSCTTASRTRHFNTAGANVFEKNTDSCVRENISENHFQRGFNGGSGAKTNDKWKNIQRSKKLKSETSEDSEGSTGSVGQVVRAVIMVGFASLVLLTRQKNK